MRTLLQHIESLEKKDRIFLASLLGFQDPKKATVKEIASRMSSHVGIELIFSQCNSDEISILQILAENDVHFRDIEHNLRIPIYQIEKIAQLLKNKSVVYILKNRQLLSNKLDKICLYSELRQLLNPINATTLREYSNEIIKHIATKKSHQINHVHLSANALQFLHQCIQRGCIVSVKYAIKILGISKAQSILNELLIHRCIGIYHVLSSSFTGVIIVNPDFIQIKYDKRSITVHNHYMALIAMLKAHDCISAKGLFFTQEGNLRKSDIDTITKTVHTLSIQTTGKPLPTVQITQLALYLLSITNSLSISSTNVNCSLKHLSKLLFTPHQIVQMIVHAAGKDIHPLFPNPFPVHNDVIKTILRIIKKNSNYTLDDYIYILFLDSLPDNYPERISQIDDYYENTRINIINAINFLCAIGVIEVINNTITLSDIGKNIFQQDQKSHQVHAPSVYINPDFSLVIPYHEMPSEVSYILMAFTEISSTDVTVHAKISKIAILNAIKRGMNPDIFISVLQQYAKNQLPQNIQFQLNEWIERTPSVTIKRGIILYSDKKDFIDELSHSLPKGVIIERIGENHILIDETALDTVIKIVQKKEVVISIQLNKE
ncbi:MAG: helicase-associated domain-containing protein [Spirochaetes bacterium]|nr:helicase-associated domain-containing protein [Spirochaetota bacterium]